MVDLNFFYPRWGAEHIDWPTFLDKVKREGYVGIEWFPFGESLYNDYNFVFDLLEERGLQYIIVMTVQNSVKSFFEYVNLLEKQLFELINLGRIKPLFISAQIGREYYTIDQICTCIDICNSIERKTGIPIFQETHRNKWNYGIHRILPILNIYPNLKFTLDISHWFCVSESFLEDQQEFLSKFLRNVYHIHARVGHTQSAQVYDVGLPIYANAVEEHIQVWQQYLNIKKENKCNSVTITTEFGPPPYLISSGDRDKDYAKQWQQNLWIRNHLETNFIL